MEGIRDRSRFLGSPFLLAKMLLGSNVIGVAFPILLNCDRSPAFSCVPVIVVGVAIVSWGIQFTFAKFDHTLNWCVSHSLSDVTDYSTNLGLDDHARIDVLVFCQLPHA